MQNADDATGGMVGCRGGGAKARGDKCQQVKGQALTLKSPPSPETCQKSKFRHESHNITSETSYVVTLITCSEYM